jgi:hypothetical protein
VSRAHNLASSSWCTATRQSLAVAAPVQVQLAVLQLESTQVGLKLHTSSAPDAARRARRDWPRRAGLALTGGQIRCHWNLEPHPAVTRLLLEQLVSRLLPAMPTSLIKCTRIAKCRAAARALGAGSNKLRLAGSWLNQPECLSRWPGFRDRLFRLPCGDWRRSEREPAHAMSVAGGTSSFLVLAVSRDPPWDAGGFCVLPFAPRAPHQLEPAVVQPARTPSSSSFSCCRLPIPARF